MLLRRRKPDIPLPAACVALMTLAAAVSVQAQSSTMPFTINTDGTYTIGANTLTAQVAAEVDTRWLRAADYPHHAAEHHAGTGPLGPAQVWTITFSGLKGVPNLTYTAHAYTQQPFADVQAAVVNTTGHPIHVQAIRPLDAVGSTIAALGGPAAADRVLSDSFSEDRPAMRLHDLGQPETSLDRAVGSQLIYNRDSHRSLFIGALTSDRFLTILRLHLQGTRIAHYEVESTGTTEMERENSLEHAPATDQVELSLPVAAGASLSSETIAISVSNDYHAQLETYGSLIRQLHHARISAPPLLGWWSWTAYYFGLNTGAALTNAQWEAQHLLPYGYNVFHIDEGYQYARGEYATPNATLFPEGLSPVAYQVRGLGLTPGIWTAPFEVSIRSWVYTHHPDWLVHNAQGRPIAAGSVVDDKDTLFMLDTTNPGAQQYLHDTYTKLVRDWDIHYIKLDFMDDSAIEGYYFRPGTTAMEAQRIGLKTIRDAIGPDVYLDKDGSVMLNPVGYVDYGRLSQDTGHSFSASHDAAPGIAARYYMNRNYFVADPDAFTVSTQRITDQTWHEGSQPLSLAEAQVSMALAAVSGGMLEIGDNLPSLQNTPDRVALIENRDLIDMVRLGRSSVPLDLMSYAPSDEQPSIFYLRESARQSILTVFNWTEHSTHHTLRLDSDLHLPAGDQYEIDSVLDAGKAVPAAGAAVPIDLPPHSVRVLKIVDTSLLAEPPSVQAAFPATARSGQAVPLAAHATAGSPVLSYQWSFGDGVTLEGAAVQHTWTEPGDYTVRLTATALDQQQTVRTFPVHIKGYIPSTFDPVHITRYEH